MAETAPQPEPLPTALSDADSFRYYPAYHVPFHDRSHHLQPGADRQGQQTLPHVGSQFAQCHAHRLRHGGLVRVDLPILVVLAQGGPLPRDVLGGSPEYLPHGKTQAGDRHLKFHESRGDGLDSPRVHTRPAP
jgi:hypothetical protein